MLKTEYEELINSNVSDSKQKNDNRYTKPKKTPRMRTKASQTKSKATLLTDGQEIMTPRQIAPETFPHTPWRERLLNRRRR